MTPRSEAIAFRIWAYATPLGWDCTVSEIADELGLHWKSVSNICKSKGWRGRLRETLEYDSAWSADAFRSKLTPPPVREVLRDLGLTHA